MRCILHIGHEKTGTKTLQAFLNRNRERLARDSVLFPKSPGRRNHRKLALVAYGPNMRDDITALARVDSAADLANVRSSLLADLERELESLSPGMVLLSSEHFQSRLVNTDSISSFRDALLQVGCHRFTVLIYLRDPVEIARSLHTTAVASGSTASGPPEPDSPYFRNICEHRATLERWCSVFGAEAVMPRLFDRSELVGGSIINDFCDTMRIKVDPSWPMPPDQNQSISALGLALLRRLNKTFPRVLENRINPERDGLADFIRQNCAGAPYSPTPELANAYRQHFSESNEWVREHFFPDRPALFPENPSPQSATVRASTAELDALAGLIGALWKERNARKTGDSTAAPSRMARQADP